jgi:hypothetical protein
MSNFEKYKSMNNNPQLAGQALSERAANLRIAARAIPADVLATRTGSKLLAAGQGDARLMLMLFKEEIYVNYPSFEIFNASGGELPVFHQVLILYYFATSTGVPLSGNWVSFADLPDGRIYAQAFQGYTGDLVAKPVGQDLGVFHKLCKRAGGEPVRFSDAAYYFQALPRVPLLLIYWPGDEEFPSTCKVLFDSESCSYLPIDACAIIGNMLVKRVLKFKEAS